MRTEEKDCIKSGLEMNKFLAACKATLAESRRRVLNRGRGAVGVQCRLLLRFNPTGTGAIPRSGPLSASGVVSLSDSFVDVRTRSCKSMAGSLRGRHLPAQSRLLKEIV